MPQANPIGPLYCAYFLGNRRHVRAVVLIMCSSIEKST